MLGTGSLFQRIRKVTYIDANITVTQKVEIGRNCIFIAFQCLTHSRYRKTTPHILHQVTDQTKEQMGVTYATINDAILLHNGFEIAFQ
ncbi:hypothetical protein BACOVA_02856 [Bacteroides ovatus ATCC 8483]|uniref:Uncharacterized protein n=1 Tax=Bacteroides ovatus (strain ATCC 8483 / DSM 1896 / JCM 5824 / BCRC 10623 / CCUG 4943 / NCTC 11153) TaxID=411476 RepID=A0AAN3D7Y2_BACO1|nr:hypothetical protein BACOVA_02856 [Bacteroides ovatus ATCC 8483]